MKRTIIIVIVTVVVAIVTLFLSRTAFSSAPALMPEVVKMEGVSYISGGIGESESNMMKSQAKDYMLEIIFIQKPVVKGSEVTESEATDATDINQLDVMPDKKEKYLANIPLQIKDHHLNSVLNLVTDGPYFLADLPLGKYLLIAEHNGSVQQQWVNVVLNKHQKVVFWWPE